MTCRRNPLTLSLATVAVLILLGPGCKKDDAKKTVESSDVAVKTEAAALTTEVRAEVERKLFKADALDGTTDKVVSKCVICALRMDGSDEHTAELAGYTLHFCSESCKTYFEADPVAKVLAVQIESP
jgi:YHS domain-containing protein